MSWVRVDDQFPDHPKVAKAGALAGWLYVCGLCYAGRYLTDGFIPAAQVRRLADVDDASALAERLVAVGLWEQADGGYQIHDYLEYNPNAEKVIATRAARAEAGRHGGQKSGTSRSAHIDEANDQANAKQIASGFASPGLQTMTKQTRSKIEPRTPTPNTLSTPQPSYSASPREVPDPDPLPRWWWWWKGPMRRNPTAAELQDMNAWVNGPAPPRESEVRFGLDRARRGKAQHLVAYAMKVASGAPEDIDDELARIPTIEIYPPSDSAPATVRSPATGNGHRPSGQAGRAVPDVGSASG